MSQENDVKLEIFIKPERELFYSGDSNFGIYAVAISKDTDDSEKIEMNDYGNFTMKGSMPQLEFGKEYKAKVTPKKDKKYGMGYEVSSIYELTPTSKKEQKKFLEAILTEKQVEEIFKVYKDEDVISLIEENKFDYSKVHGMAEKTYLKVKEKVIENLEYREAIVELSDRFGITYNMIKKMSDSYGSATLLIQKILEDPYILCYDVDGIGFKKADAIALSNGVEETSPKRIGACVIYTITQESSSGNCWISKNKLTGMLTEELNIRMKHVQEYVEDIESDARINSQLHIEGDKVGLKSSYNAEKGVAENIKRLLDIEDNYHITDVEGKIYEAEQEQGFDFTDEQREAIEMAVRKNVVIVNGKAGTGKTSVLKGILSVLTAQEGLRYATCALSGKASQRIQESTGLQSYTIHRLLGFNPMGGFTFNELNQLEHDVIVLDEASMVNSPLMFSLVRAVKDGAKLIILGDTAQLEPIGVGNTLVDLIKSNTVPRVELTIVHRQAQKSGILSVANEVREGISFAKKDDYNNRRVGELEDLIFYPYKSGETVYKSVLQIAKKYSGSILDFQVIVPLKSRGMLSAKQLNEDLQHIFNPDEIGKPSIKKGKTILRKGDKVIQNGNNYDLNVFNGTIGIIEYIDTSNKIVVIDFEGVGKVSYEGESIGQIDLAYALTVHRTQGSQWKYVLYALDYSSYVLLSRQLTYTALTRASSKCFLVAELRAFNHSVRTDKSTKRNTFLEAMLKKDTV